MNSIALAGAICGLLYLLILITKALLSRNYLRSHPEDNRLNGEVTVLQPILGGDPNLKESLLSNLILASPETRFWWLLDEDDQVGNDVARELQIDYPDRVRIISAPPLPDGVNPKTFKLDRIACEIESEFVAVLDDDTTLSPDHLEKALAVLTHADIYTGIPCYRVGQNFWSSLVAHFVNNNSIVTYLSLLNWIPPLTINGMFYVVRRESLVRWGGWGPITSELCDDYAFASHARRQGAVIHQGITPQMIETTGDGPAHYFRLLHRWFVFANVLVRDQSSAINLLLFLVLGIPPLLLWGSFLLISGGWIGIGLLACILVVRHSLIRLLHYAAFPDPPKFSFLISLLSELSQLIHYIHSLVSSVILWRSRRIRVLPDGKFESLTSANK